MDARREHLVARAIAWSRASAAWAALVGVSSLLSGIAASSVALVAFGANSVLDGAASGVLLWRFHHEGRGKAVALVERRAALAVGVVMAAVALWIGAGAFVSLATHSAPQTSVVGVVLTGASIFVLPVLARAKLRLAAPLGSPGLRGDGILSLAGGVLAAATLMSLVLHSAFDFWWADAVAALAISFMLGIEGLRTVMIWRSMTS